jgi:transcriptional regulator with XRE-family HTH domain
MTTSSETKKFLNRLIGKEPTFGEVVAALRGSEEISQAAFARKLGVTRQVLNDIESGRRPATLALASKWAKKIGLSPAVLIERAVQDQLNAAKVGLRVRIEAA